MSKSEWLSDLGWRKKKVFVSFVFDVVGAKLTSPFCRHSHRRRSVPRDPPRRPRGRWRRRPLEGNTRCRTSGRWSHTPGRSCEGSPSPGTGCLLWVQLLMMRADNSEMTERFQWEYLPEESRSSAGFSHSSASPARHGPSFQSPSMIVLLSLHASSSMRHLFPNTSMSRWHTIFVVESHFRSQESSAGICTKGN